MDKVARQDIAAAAAARQELGSSYDDVIAESLIEHIGAEIDKRVDAKLEGRRRPRRTDVAELERRRTLWKGATVGAAATGVPAAWIATASYDPGKGVAAIVLLIWAAIAVGYVIARWVHVQRERGD
jgi:hypothetical protein